MEGKDAKPELNPSFHTLFQAYPAQRNRIITRSNPYGKSGEPETTITTKTDSKEKIESGEGEMEGVNFTPENPVEDKPKVVPIKGTETGPKNTNNQPKKKPAAKKRPAQKVQPSIAAHIQPYNIVADLQQQKANISFGQLFQISPKLRSDVNRSLRKPGARNNTKMSAQLSDQIGPNATALYCDAEVRGRMIPLIIDSGAAGSIVSCQFLNEVGIAIDRPSTTLMINVNGERKRPLGEVLNFPITVQGVTVPIDVVVTDALTYSAIVGNDWLSKVNASIDYGTASMIIHWQGKETEIPIEFLEMPDVRRRKQEEAIHAEIEEIDGDEERDSEEDESEDEEEYEEEELEEKVFCCALQEERSEQPPVRFTCEFQDVVLGGIYPREDLVLVNSGVYLGKSFCTWDYFRRLNERFKMRPPKEARWVYDWKGPTSRCWCNHRLHSPSDSCYMCQNDLINYITLRGIPTEIVKELSTEPSDSYGPPTQGQQEEDTTPQSYNQVVLKKIADDQDRQSCFYCGMKSHLEWEERTKALPFMGHAELEKVVPTKFDELSVGDLNPIQRMKFEELLNEYRDLFAWEPTQLGRTNLVRHTIDVGNSAPIKKRWYRTSQGEREFIAQEIQRMLQQGLIEKAKGPWAFPVVLVRKKNGKLRFCVDYRPLNKVTKRDEYPLPRIDDMLDSLGGSAWFTSLDLASGYWQVEMEPSDREKTAFITQFGTYQFTVMPFGLCNAPATFQRLMDEVLHDELWKIVVVYLDDLNIFSKTFDDHLKHLRIVFDRLKKAGLKLNPEKCRFTSSELAFLGHVISKDGIRTDPDKIEKVKNFPEPKNLTQLRGFLGLASYYRRFIKDFSKIANPLNKLLKKSVPYAWKKEQQQAFDYLKECLISSPILTYPNWDRPFTLFTDASTFALGAVLTQKDEGDNEHVIAYASRSLQPAEKNYSATELECLAVVWAIGKFHQYLHGKRFTLITDHSALCHLFNTTTPSGRLARWVLKLQVYDFDTIHRAGKTHSNVDSLSRIH